MNRAAFVVVHKPILCLFEFPLIFLLACDDGFLQPIWLNVTAESDAVRGCTGHRDRSVQWSVQLRGGGNGETGWKGWGQGME